MAKAQVARWSPVAPFFEVVFRVSNLLPSTAAAMTIPGPSSSRAIVDLAGRCGPLSEN